MTFRMAGSIISILLAADIPAQCTLSNSSRAMAKMKKLEGFIILCVKKSKIKKAVNQQHVASIIISYNTCSGINAF